MSAAPSDAGEGMTRGGAESRSAASGPAEPRPAAGPHAEAAVPEPTPVPTLNLANLLTLSRLVLVPLFVLALFSGDGADTAWRAVATGLFVIASATDQVDGWVARKYGLITDFGKIADPIADKALIGAALIGLSGLGELSWWVTIVIAVREIGVTLLRFWVIRHGVIPASRGGKAKTMTQILAIVVYLLPLPAGADPVRWVLMGLAVALTVVTGVDYLVRAVRLRAAGRRATGS
ncbi:CDP-diacylglycerol--glycerol-3-phosphate 3-phosphatidyltransferase [Amycolatopsis sp. PS_44_ISF1]|uniref:CDP-diacylglycerol--glycerol-3-phosphate 3-phosphatidyltransferase n=1 Tax=Amycolatopsis sp. PS_44_ISF1 TaxID=2974917 RepID=UPI0028DDFA2F|nr:CDP-diacylglycerol--glycerol-3-phosphate 3-phosphatidyltransferase [Amycolatopsis sp. PS_44_ISF1]MDT8914836.1 CDP-diacylglycerol--glycerol-3-phosphate 3-phosphatidyltransferase [Amycolatopsis sp. PS_44_ISF1]